MKKPSGNFSRRVLELRKVLNKANHAYYVLDAPLMEDAVFDRLYRELLEIEKHDPSLITQDSPSQRLGGKPSKGFQSVKHRIPLQSLENAFNLDELENWYLKIKKSLEQEVKMICELKIDGNALALSYSNGFLERATTRGDGFEGEDITSNVKTIGSIPLSLQLKNPPPWLEVRGEALMPNEIFEKINQLRQKEEKQVFANPRNACSGTLRQLDPQIVASRKLDFFAYTIHLPNEWEPTDEDYPKPKGQKEGLQWLKKAGFKVNPNTKTSPDLEEVKDFCNLWEIRRQTLPYTTDGIVIKLESFEQQKTLGVTNKAPRWAIALKFPAEESPTQLTKLTFQIGRTGAVTPVAKFKPITLAGTLVSRATLHNANRLAELDLHSGDTIVVRKAGEIIPEVVRVIKELRPQKASKLFLPTICPECNQKLLQAQTQAATKCTNNSCPAILRGGLRHWVSKNGMNIEGLGTKLIEQLVEKKLVSSIAGIYNLDKQSITKLERMGEKSAEKLLYAIEESKKKPWHKQLFALGILHIGEANAKAIANVFPNVSELEKEIINAPESISNIYGIGNEIVESLKQWFTSPNNQELIKLLQEAGITLANTYKEKLTIKNQEVAGKIITITGTFNVLNRNEIKGILENLGGKVTSSISSKTSFLIAGEKPGSKLRKAKELNIKIIGETELINILNQVAND
ncbi:NAD-dependent DNA ligase LigA [Prochlorococcus marinus]|uniref:NAD-dependent DNA ligase LigA n=1 Tax=Prochlorococcus marinus TaxID=1219 RepID=UPI0022B2F524|nr:NAD-dependent DNA ligase LigA [Prochlorococcus marinus]